MKNSKRNRERKAVNYNRISLILITAIVLVFLGVMMRGSRRLESRLASYDARVVALEERLETEKARSTEIAALRKYMNTDEYAEDMAREKLGLVKADEMVFQEGDPEEMTEPPVEEVTEYLEEDPDSYSYDYEDDGSGEYWDYYGENEY